MNWNDETVLVTGATGLVGSWLVRALLERGSRVVCLVRDHDPQSELLRSGDLRRTVVVEGRLEDRDCLVRAVVEHEVSTVFHLGAQTIVGAAQRSPVATFEANIQGTWNLLEACRLHPDLVRRVVVASSDKAYGTGPSLPYTEDMPASGRHPYDVSKSCTDLLSATYAHSYGLPVIVARCGNIYGGGDLNWSRIVPGTIRSVLRGEPPVLRSDGTFLRDYVYVEDVVEAYLLLAEALEDPTRRGRGYNFSVGDPTSVLEITRCLLRLLDREDLEPVILDQAPNEIRDQYLDSTRAREELGWEPDFTLDEGLARTIQWYRDFEAAP